MPIPITARGRLDDSTAVNIGLNESAGELPGLALAFPFDVVGDCLPGGLEDEVAPGDDFGPGVCAAGGLAGRAEGAGGAEPGLTASPLICFKTLLPPTLPGQEPSESYV